MKNSFTFKKYTSRIIAVGNCCITGYFVVLFINTLMHGAGNSLWLQGLYVAATALMVVGFVSSFLRLIKKKTSVYVENGNLNIRVLFKTTTFRNGRKLAARKIIPGLLHLYDGTLAQTFWVSDFSEDQLEVIYSFQVQ